MRVVDGTKSKKDTDGPIFIASLVYTCREEIKGIVS
jgi:hypothetical protein